VAVSLLSVYLVGWQQLLFATGVLNDGPDLTLDGLTDLTVVLP